jgi:hypothetical protein
MSIALKLAFTSTCLLTLLTGCGVPSTTSLRDMSTAYREVIEEYGNDNILLNIVRSSESMPVSFLDMPTIVGTGNITGSATLGATIVGTVPGSLPGFFTAGATSSAGPTATLSATNGFNFTQSSLDNAAFMGSFLGEIKPEAIRNLSSNTHGPESILYTLVVESLEFRNSQNKTIDTFHNDPFSPQYPKFQEALYGLLEEGLSTESIMSQVPLSPVMDKEMVTENMRAMVAAYSLPGVMLLPIQTPQTGVVKYQLTRMVPTTRICLIRKDQSTFFQSKLSSGAFCSRALPGSPMNSVSTAPTAQEKQADVDKISLIIKLRSTRSVFEFLGALTFLQNLPDGKQIMVKDSDQFSTNPGLARDKSTSYAAPLFVVKKNAPSSERSLAQINYRGNTYSIPAKDAGTSRQVMVLLSQLLTLNKVAGSIPQSPAVLIR